MTRIGKHILIQPLEIEIGAPPDVVIRDDQHDQEVVLQSDQLAAAIAALDYFRVTTPPDYQAAFWDVKRNLASPPPGWFTFGSHVAQPDVTLEFWGDEGGVPIWERPTDG